MSQNKILRRRKYNIIELGLLWVLILGWFFFKYTVDSEYTELTNNRDEIKKEIRERDEQIAENPENLRISEYSDKLVIAEAIIKKKHFKVDWYEYFKEIKMHVPKGVTVSFFKFNWLKNEVSFDLVSSAEQEILSTIKSLESYTWIEGLRFTSIVSKDIIFEWDKTKYKWYSVSLTGEVPESYIAKLFEQKESLRKLKYSESNTDNVINISDSK